MMNKKVFLIGLLSSWTLHRYRNRFFEPIKCFNDLSPNFQKVLSQKETDLYIWGKGDVKSTSVYNNFHPHKIKKLDELKEIPNFIDIVFGEQIALAIDKNHNLYTWKEPKLNSEKNENVNNHERKQIMQLAKNYKIVQAAVTKDKIFFITKDGKLFFINYKVTIPENKDSYFTIKSNEEIINIFDDKIIHVKELSNIKSISTGKDHIIALDKDGNMFGMGDDSYGILTLIKVNLA
jgi:alpha-tubulin suppressor-like RCC1 family protein